MKHIFNFVYAVVILSCLEVGCTLQEPIPVQNSISNITFVTPIVNGEPLSKTSYDIEDKRFLWSATDTIGIISSNGSQIFFPIDDSYVGGSSAQFDGRGWALLSNETYMAYYPFIEDFHLDYEKIPVSFYGQKQITNNSFEQIGNYAFWVAKGVSPDNGKLNFQFTDVASIMRVDLPAFKGQYDSLVLWIDDISNKNFTLTGTVDISAEQPAITPELLSKRISLSLEKCSLSSDSLLQCAMMIAPLDLSNTQVHIEAFRRDGIQVNSSFQGKEFTTAGYRYVQKSQVSIMPGSIQISADGGIVEVSVIYRPGANPVPVVNLTSQNEWIVAKGDGIPDEYVITYSFDIAENTANTQRTGTIKVTDSTNNLENYVTITQGKTGYIVGVSNWEEENHSGKAN